MKTIWNYSDTIDLDGFLEEDGNLPPKILHERDRQIHGQLQSSGIPVENHLALLQGWLYRRREEHGDPTVGRQVARTLTALRQLLATLACITGCGAGLAALSYSGTTPVNVLYFLALFVLLQIALAVLLLLRKTISGLVASTGATTLVERLLLVCWNHLIKRRLTARHREQLQATRGGWQIFQERHRDQLGWQLVALSQLAGVFFNLGLLLGMIFTITVKDVAFGWQSTLVSSPQAIESLVNVLAWPWSAALPGAPGVPSPAEIAGSRIVLKDGIASLTSANLAAWYPFLLLCTLTYGLLPRLVLYLAAGSAARRRAANGVLERPQVRRLLGRMTTPVVSSQAEPEQSPTTSHLPNHQPPSRQDRHLPAKGGARLLIPDEIWESLDSEALAEHLAALGISTATRHRFQAGYEQDQQLLTTLTEPAADNHHNQLPVVILMEAWMPPLTSFLSYLQELRRRLAPATPISILLLGKPTAGRLLTPVTDETQLTTWRQKITGLGDSYLDLAPLIPPEQSP